MRHSKPIFVFDWDDVVADKESVWRLIYDLFRLAGVPHDTIQVTLQKVMPNGYSFRSHLREILRYQPHLIPAAATLDRAFYESNDRLTQIYQDAELFMQRLHGRYPMAILTTGDTEFQQRKIWRSGLERYVDHMLFVPQEGEETIPARKSRALGQLLEMYPRIFFFEDQPTTIGQVHKEHDHHRRIVPIRVNRKLESSIKYPNIIRHFDEFDLERWVGAKS
jgi:FMN phosphatase YigB (HAD superfamily)